MSFIRGFFCGVCDFCSSLSAGVPGLSFVLYSRLGLGRCLSTQAPPHSSGCTCICGAESCHIQEFMPITTSSLSSRKLLSTRQKQSFFLSSSPCRWSVPVAKGVWQGPTEQSLCLVRCVPKWARSAQTACCSLTECGRSNLLVGAALSCPALAQMSLTYRPLKATFKYRQHGERAHFLTLDVLFSQGSPWTTAVAVTASPLPKCARSCRTPWLRCSSSPPTAATSRAPTGTVSCSTPQPSPLFTWACSAS